MLTWNQWIENLKYNGMNRENKAIDFKIKEQIWERVKARCVDRKRNKVLSRTKMVFCRSFTRSFTNNRRILDEFRSEIILTTNL